MVFSLLACGRAQTAGEGLATTLPWLDRQADVLQVAPHLPVANVDDTDRSLADLSGQARVGPFANNDHGVAFRHEPFDLKGDVRCARHRLAAEEDEGLPAQDRLGHSRRSVDDVGMKTARKAVPIARGAHPGPPSRYPRPGYERWKTWRANRRAPTRAAPAAATSTAAAATSFARPIIGWCSGHA